MFDTNTTAIAKAIPSFSLEALDKLYPKLDALMKLQSDLSTKQVLTGEIAFESERLLPAGGVLSAHYGTTTDVRKYTFAMEGISLGIAAAVMAIVAAIVVALKKFWDWISGTSSYSSGGGSGGGSFDSKHAEIVQENAQTGKKLDAAERALHVVQGAVRSASSGTASAGIRSQDLTPDNFIKAMQDNNVDGWTPPASVLALSRTLNGEDANFNFFFGSTDAADTIIQVTKIAHSNILGLKSNILGLLSATARFIDALAMANRAQDAEQAQRAGVHFNETVAALSDRRVTNTNQSFLGKTYSNPKELLEAAKDHLVTLRELSRTGKKITLRGAEYCMDVARKDDANLQKAVKEAREIADFIEEAQKEINEVNSKLDNLTATHDDEDADEKAGKALIGRELGEPIKAVADQIAAAMALCAITFKFADDYSKTFERHNEHLKSYFKAVNTYCRHLQKKGVIEGGEVTELQAELDDLSS